MVLDKSCPGSRTIREPRPEYEVWRHYDNLKEKLVELRTNGSKPSAVVFEEVQEISSHIGSLLLAHIKRENESLLPLANRLL